MSGVEEDIRKKIERERNIIQGASNLKKKTRNEMVIQKCDMNIREAQQNIKYLEETLQKFQLTSNDQGSTTDPTHISSSNGNTNTAKGYGQLSTIGKNENTYSRLDLVKYDCPSLAQRIQYMLQQLEFKLQVERQYQEANTKLTKLYQIDGDQRTSSAAQGEREESKSRIQLLTKALKKYQAINVDIDQLKATDTASISSTSQPKFRRKQLSGVLTININAIRDVDHIQSPMFLRKPDTYITVKIDDAIKSRTRPSRTDKWHEEFHIQVGKGNEVEITVYDDINNKLTPVAVMWFLLSDIAEAIRKIKVGKTNEQQGWVNASRLISTRHDTHPHNGSVNGTPSSLAKSNTRLPPPSSGSNLRSPGNEPLPITIQSWFVLEPTGKIQLTLGFAKTSEIKKKNIGAAGGLHRQGAIVNRNEEIYEQHGHHFVQKSFYNIMECAYCGEFLRYNGLQCQDCRFLCHKKCYTNVVTKCIAKTTSDADPSEANLSHHIPHRFEPFSNRGTKWCCHCGYILPWGRQKVRKCSECGVMCHAQCAHLVPDFCGMSMEMANKILQTIQDTQRSQEKRKRRSSQLVKKRPSTLHKQTSATTTPRQPETPQPIPPTHREPDISPLRGHGLSPKKISMSDISMDSDQNIPITEPSTKTADLFGEQDLYSNFTTNATTNEQPGTHGSPSKESIGTKHFSQTSYPDININEPFSEQHQNIPEPIQLLSTSTSNVIQPEIAPDINLENNIPIESLPSGVNPFRDMNEDSFQEQQDTAITETSPEKTQHFAKSEKHISKSSLSSISPHKVTQTRHKRKASKRRKVSLDDFILLKVLGKGNFGKVLLSKSKNTGTICAIKVLKKDHIIQNHDIESARAEKKVFLLASKAKHPFLTNLYCSFQTENRIYFAMEFVGGGDLMWHVQNQRLSVRRAKFYAAEVLLALKYFHENGVIYRDLKLENILLTPEGHIKMADYGLCKDEMWFGNTTSTFCGTPEFMAPEILKEQEYTKAVDWWAFGVLLYQMLLCQSPFSGDDEDEVFNAILTDEPLYPIDMAGDIVQIFQGLLTKDPESRLGAGPRDALEVMEEPFFNNINFDDILNLRTKPPYIPKINGSEDTSYFEQEFTAAPPTLTPIPSVLSIKDQEEFRGFSFMPDDLEL
ncbi:hypothetical protein TBLA_0I00910 [Henningerozyma blattae CBS 6284]|uniref:Protein kinase C-like 1 n=1 Tax=Henningerozyma blattae (strain ATCC 34711 / CBS 6284 / DSM 70876 / NBRC 10599 / NRRL Y-10934 / UCD 77-7) TaxID=1071380 RepID=I2H8P8_HENB6|nr:hypothetical protein TBLA_0I00910 [Tetrapisispora blattae CBS 6284]CCH62750.1 hypothetical protein TBLA_0I00910 [Tetrapisispora blattae CBS 6284]